MRERRWCGWLILILALTLGGCYESAFPIETRPEADIDQALVGTWRCLPFDQDPSEKAGTITIAPDRPRIYAATFQEDGGTPSRYEIYASTAASGLINARELADGDKKPWMFVRVKILRPSVFQLQVLDKGALSDQPRSLELRKAVEHVRDKAGAFSDVCVCVRARPAKADAR